MDAEAKARLRAKDLSEAAETFRRTGGVIERKETIKSLPPEVVRRIEMLETQNLQIMQGLQAVLQALEDERAKREGMEGALAGWAETHLQKRA